MRLQQLSKREIPVDSIKYCDKSKIEIRNSIHNIGSNDERFWRKFFNEKIDKKKLCIVSQPPDGDCLFHSLAKYVPNMNARKLRTDIVNFEKQHKQFQVTQMVLVDPSEFPEFENYLEYNDIEFKKLSKAEKFKIYLNVMKKTGVYGQNLEIKVFSDMYNLNVVILKTNNFINIILPEDGVSEKSIFLFYSGNHYDVLYVEPDNIYKKCPVNKVLNPKTGNCILKTSSIGKKLVKEKCLSEGLKNPVTGRCVDTSGKIGKKLLKENKIQKCDEQRGFNPKSGRCVIQKGKIGGTKLK